MRAKRSAPSRLLALIPLAAVVALCVFLPAEADGFVLDDESDNLLGSLPVELLDEEEGVFVRQRAGESLPPLAAFVRDSIYVNCLSFKEIYCFERGSSLFFLPFSSHSGKVMDGINAFGLRFQHVCVQGGEEIQLLST